MKDRSHLTWRPQPVNWKWPLGVDTSVLVLCPTMSSRKTIALAYNIKGMYLPWASPVTGYRFRTIHVMNNICHYLPTNLAFNDYLADLKTRLEPNGELRIIK